MVTPPEQQRHHPHDLLGSLTRDSATIQHNEKVNNIYEMCYDQYRPHDCTGKYSLNGANPHATEQRKVQSK